MSRLGKGFLFLPVVLLMMGGCGSSADGENGDGREVSKGEFIKEADAICRKADRAQNEAIAAFRKENPDDDSSPSWEEDLIVSAGLPSIQAQAEELGDLPVPSGDGDEIDAIVEGMERAVEEARRNPSSMLEKGSVGPFTEVFKLAEEYGFKDCSTPI